MTTCPVPSCTGEVPAGKLLCLQHWKRVPVAYQRQVLITWRNFQASPAGTHRLRWAKKYRVARDRALEAVSHG